MFTSVTIVAVIAARAVWIMIASVAIIATKAIVFAILLYIKAAKVICNHFLWICFLIHSR